MPYTIEMTYDQVESIVVQELQTAIEMCLLNMSEDSSLEEDINDHDLLNHLLHVLQYFTTHSDFQKFIQEVKDRFGESLDLEEIFSAFLKRSKKES